MAQFTAQELEMIRTELEKNLKEQRNKPFVVSVMGQTGVGKSSLINALFDTDLKVDPVRPATKKIEPIEKKTNGHTLIFYDMPGIGESDQIDSTLLEDYRRHLRDSDVVLWAIHADTRSTALDARTLQHLLEGIAPEEKQLLMSRITFVLTKADLLAQSAWTMGYAEDYAIFNPGKKTKELFEQKATYYQEQIISHYGAYITSWTYNDVRFRLSDNGFSHTDESVYYRGLLTRDRVKELKKQYPHYSTVFDRLYDNYRVIACSSFFKYNLVELMHAILNKIGPNAIESFKQVLNLDYLDRVPLDLARQRCNLYIVDTQKKITVFNLINGVFPNAKRGSILMASHTSKYTHWWSRFFSWDIHS